MARLLSFLHGNSSVRYVWAPVAVVAVIIGLGLLNSFLVEEIPEGFRNIVQKCQELQKTWQWKTPSSVAGSHDSAEEHEL